jgi:hypothetical protein
MSDLTIIFLTENTLPKRFMKFQRKHLLRAAGDNEMVTMSRKPMVGFGKNILQDRPRGLHNIYRQLWRGAKAAKTEFVAVAEDDTLYPPDHFQMERLRHKNAFSYNQHNWKLFNWGPPVFHWRMNYVNYCFIADRQLLVDTLGVRMDSTLPEEHRAMSSEPGKRWASKALGIPHPTTLKVWGKRAVVTFNHDMGFDIHAQEHRKPMGPIRATEIPYWGRAEDLVRRWG